MGQVAVTALRAVGLPEQQNTIVPQEERVRAQSLVAAVQVLNEAGVAGTDREVTYSTDATTRQTVIRVVDKQSRDVIVQWPSEYVLSMAEEYRKERRTK